MLINWAIKNGDGADGSDVLREECDRIKSSNHFDIVEGTALPDSVQQEFKLSSDGEKIDLSEDLIKLDFLCDDIISPKGT